MIVYIIGLKYLKVISCFVGRTGTKCIIQMLNLQEYGVTKKWVIITEISKEVENNTIARVNDTYNTVCTSTKWWVWRIIWKRWSC